MTTEVTIADEAASPAADEAARAAAAAAAASDAASQVAALASVEAANVTEAARSEISSYEERLNQCQAGLQTTIQSHDALSADLADLRSQTASRLGELAETLSSIVARLETKPEHPSSPENGQPEAAAHEIPESLESPPEPAPVVKRRAHRWI